MSGVTKISLAIAMLACAPFALAADDIYESFDDLEIGPVFLTPSERELLDRQRLLPPPDPAAAASVEQAAEKTAPKKAAAGYIISSKSGRRDWSDGDFVSTTEATRTDFPGEVRVIRHPPRAADDDGETD